VTPAARARHAAGRALVRRLVGGMLGCAPDDVVVQGDRHGRPFVEVADVHVSIAHTRGLAVAAVSRGRQVGVDVERTTRSPLPPPRLWLGAGDQRRLARRSEVDRADALVRCWTAKEAVAKASGLGLGLALTAIEVDGDRAWLERAPERGWDLRDVVTVPGFTTTLAVAWSGVAPGPTATDRGGAGAPQSAGAGQSSWNCPATMPDVAVTGHVTRMPSDAVDREGRTTHWCAWGGTPW